MGDIIRRRAPLHSEEALEDRKGAARLARATRQPQVSGQRAAEAPPLGGELRALAEGVGDRRLGHRGAGVSALRLLKSHRLETLLLETWQLHRLPQGKTPTTTRLKHQQQQRRPGLASAIHRLQDSGESGEECLVHRRLRLEGGGFLLCLGARQQGSNGLQQGEEQEDQLSGQQQQQLEEEEEEEEEEYLDRLQVWVLLVGSGMQLLLLLLVHRRGVWRALVECLGVARPAWGLDQHLETSQGVGSHHHHRGFHFKGKVHLKEEEVAQLLVEVAARKCRLRRRRLMVLLSNSWVTTLPRRERLHHLNPDCMNTSEPPQLRG